MNLFRYVEKISASSSSNEHVGSNVISSVEDEFLNNPDFMLIGFLGTIPTTKKVLVLGTITATCTDKIWYYNGCNHCKSGVEERFVTKENADGSFDVDHAKSLVCTNDKCEGVDIYSIPRFKIPIRVQDSSGTVSLTLFVFEAYKILKKTAKELLSIQDQVVNSGEIPNPYPEIFDTLIGKRYAFIISVKDYNIECQDEMSCCGDNVTPASQPLVGTNNPSSDETKRNIREVFDVDDALGCSSTKRRISDELSQDEDAGLSVDVASPSFMYAMSKNSRSSSTAANSSQRNLHSPLMRTHVSDISSRSPLSDITNVTSPNKRRKLRKLILDNKKLKNASSSSTNVRNIFSDNAYLVECSDTTDQHMYSIACRAVRNATGSLISTTPGTPLDSNRRYSITSSIISSNNQPILGSNSTLTRLSSGKRNLERKKRDNTPVPMLSLDSDQDNVFLCTDEDHYKGISKDYLDHGDQVLTCQLCSAKLCTSEGGKGRLTINKLCYSMCCGYGKVQLPPLKDAHASYQNLFSSSNAKSKFFLKNIRRYNSIFSFTSMGGKLDSNINKGNAPFIYRISGQNYHCMGSLKPPAGNEAKFCQLYIHDTENEITNRQALFSKRTKPSSPADKELDVEMIEMVRNHFHQSLDANLSLRLIYRKEKDGRTYNLPTTSEVVALVVGDIYKAIDHRDIVVETQSGMLQRISELHPSYLALQYPLLFPYGDDGKEVLTDTGKPVILPSSFTGGARFMQLNYLDAMALCKWYGYPDFFITITCNPKWREVKRFLKDSTIKAEDRPGILCRLFKMKLDSLLKDFKDSKYFGEINAVVYTVDHKLPTIDHIDPFISVEIPDKEEDPKLYSLVTDYMIHGPCGNANLNCPCMVDKRCSKNFPKKFTPHTTIDSSGFPVYRRRDSGHTVIKSGVRLDNRNVVPYNKRLLKRYQAHINVEWCNQAGSVKYLFKYIKKGPDIATVVVSGDISSTIKEKPKDEIKEYYDCRYISACEASWRIFSNEVHYRYPAVMRLPFHLPGQQNVVYGADDDIDNVLSKPSVASSIFVQWMKLNETNEDARKLTYVEFPSKFVWILNDRCWQIGKSYQCVGRIHSVSPALGEPYFLRILLNKVKGPRSFEEIRTVNGQLFPTFRDACYAMGLSDDDNEYVEAIKEASFEGHVGYLRALFATLLLSNTLSRPEFVWENTWKYLADDIVYRRQKETNISGLLLPEYQIKNLTLLKIENYLISNGSSLRRFVTMPYPDDNSLRDASNRLINEELSHDLDEVEAEFNRLHQSLIDKQRAVFDEIMEAVVGCKGGLFLSMVTVELEKPFYGRLWLQPFDAEME
ncbi:uncharacterized protein LOC110901544 [Helianthus annuus]|uniref:uncharacterized protein LOC110901544 n=1 Tax=Helianthus annuus TaxID=4232 RepID=UPI0016531A28|nr:uncharacterized protein LOC110901544 [Helianthus annuus]